YEHNECGTAAALLSYKFVFLTSDSTLSKKFKKWFAEL
ncbi:unnamed protein product, partial [Larinioides sclopetarius]